MAKQKTIYCCSECGYETANWAGKCPSCGEWNTLSEVKLDSNAGRGRNTRQYQRLQEPVKLSQIADDAEIRFSTGISELDRVLGGGAVVGSLVLVGGAPGIGKSTLLLQMCGLLKDKKLSTEAEKAAFRSKWDWNRMTKQDEKVWAEIFKTLDA